MSCGVAVANRCGASVAIAGAGALVSFASPAIAMLVIGEGVMGVPWEVPIATFADAVGDRRFATVRDFAGAFFDHVETSRAIAAPHLQSARFTRCVRSVWSDYRERIEASGEPLSAILAEDRREMLANGELTELGADFGARVVSTYARELDDLERDVFGEAPPRESTAQLRATVALMHERDWCHPSDESCVVFAGMGSDDPFPAVLEYAVSSVVAQRLRRARRLTVEIGDARPAAVVPFGRRETIDTIVDGIHPDLIGVVREQAIANPSQFVATLDSISVTNLARVAESLATLESPDALVRVATLTARTARIVAVDAGCSGDNPLEKTISMSNALHRGGLEQRVDHPARRHHLR